ncbi:MAG: outer membrane lipoprotein carrier protein LolA [Leptospiraceae bacterium]|nr:outer membrane lipoprotein carrier protein LolA [Leptospiraceae bacterium]MDW8306274.1 outer membrane lipoprotein carrier protein LolA [Leptospiraceae bacterium]
MPNRLLLLSLPAMLWASDRFVHPTDVVRAVQQRFQNLKTYSAKFFIEIKESQKNKESSGLVYYQKGGKLNFTFHQPPGDVIVSDGKKLYVYVARLRALGIQDLQLTKEGKNLYETASPDGMMRLFQRYHYRFQNPQQPVTIEGATYYVLELKEKVASGSYEKILVYVNPQSYLIERMVAFSPSGREVRLRFANIELDRDLPASLFQFQATEGMRVVENPLATEG